MTTAATATNNPGSPTNTNGIPNGKSARAPMTPIDVLAFVSENVE
jgi:hypothetical protein